MHQISVMMMIVTMMFIIIFIIIYLREGPIILLGFRLYLSTSSS